LEIEVNALGQSQREREVERPFSFDIFGWNFERPQIAAPQQLHTTFESGHRSPPEREHRKQSDQQTVAELHRNGL
jgi:hypothetical protein